MASEETLPANAQQPYTIVGQHGRIVQTGWGSEVPPIEGLVIHAAPPSLEHWWDGAQFVPIPSQPQPWCVWDWPTHAWIDTRTLDGLKAGKWEQIKAVRDRLEAEGFPYLGRTFDSDPVSVQRITTVVLAAQAAVAGGQPFSIDWTCADNSVLTMTAQQVLGLPVALATYGNTLHETARALRELIASASTAEAVAAIDWPQSLENPS